MAAITIPTINNVSTAALKTQRPVKSLIRILNDFTIAPIMPAKNHSNTIVSAIFHSMGKVPRLLPPQPRKTLIAIPARLSNYK